MSEVIIPINVNGQNYYNKEEARDAWFEEWLMKQDFEKDLICQKEEVEYRRTHPNWNIPNVMSVSYTHLDVYKRQEKICMIN